MISAKKKAKQMARRIVELYQLGWKTGRVAAEVGLSMTCVRNTLKREGVPIRERPGRTPEERFYDYVCPEPNTGCWLWLGATTRGGYAHFCYVTSEGKHTSRAHRFAYELEVGPIPEGLDLDHKCMNRLCVNPAHMEPVTHRENVLRSPNTAPSRSMRGQSPRRNRRVAEKRT